MKLPLTSFMLDTEIQMVFMSSVTRKGYTIFYECVGLRFSSHERERERERETRQESGLCSLWSYSCLMMSSHRPVLERGQHIHTDQRTAVCPRVWAELPSHLFLNRALTGLQINSLSYHSLFLFLYNSFTIPSSFWYFTFIQYFTHSSFSFTRFFNFPSYILWAPPPFSSSTYCFSFDSVWQST